MKNLLLLIGLASFAIFMTSSVTKTGVSIADSKMVAKDSALPADVYKIVSSSCFSCHGTNGKAMALSHLKLEEWNGYSSEKKAQKAAAMCNMITKKKMPPKGYLSTYPDKALTQEQIELICKWSASLK